MPSKRNDSEIVNSAGGGGGGFSNPMTFTGDLIKGGISGTPSRLPIGTTGQVLSVVAGIPAWSTVVGQQGIPGINGTNGTSFTNVMTAAGDMIVGGTDGAATRLPKGTEGYRLSIVSGTPTWVAPAVGANGFVDTFIDVVSNDGTQTLPATNYSFDKVLMPNVISDIYGNYNSTTSEYTVPSSGVYQITGSLRAENNKQAGTTFGVGVHSSLADGAWFLWHAVQTTTNIYNRTTYPYIRVGLFTAGQTLKMFSFVDGTSMKVQLAGMQIIRIA